MSRLLPDGRIDRSAHPIRLTNLGWRTGGGARPMALEDGPRGRSLVHRAIDSIAVHTRSPEVSMHDR